MSDLDDPAKKTLLQQALNVKTPRARLRSASDEQIDLAIAYLKGQITAEQAKIALKSNSGAQATSHILMILRAAMTADQINIEKTS